MKKAVRSQKSVGAVAIALKLAPRANSSHLLFCLRAASYFNNSITAEVVADLGLQITLRFVIQGFEIGGSQVGNP